MITHDTFISDTAYAEAELAVDNVRGILAESSDTAPQSLRHSVYMALNRYFTNLDGQQPIDVYQMVLSEIEAPMLESVLKYTRNNQTKASALLGLNRGTLRKKLKKHGLL